MKNFNIKVEAFHKYFFSRDYVIQAASDSTAVSKAVKEFWKDPTNKRRKRKTTKLKVTILYDS